jgi:hypothetical protein
LVLFIKTHPPPPPLGMKNYRVFCWGGAGEECKQMLKVFLSQLLACLNKSSPTRLYILHLMAIEPLLYSKVSPHLSESIDLKGRGEETLVWQTVAKFMILSGLVFNFLTMVL